MDESGWNPRCEECGHTMYHFVRGWKCIENTCSIGLFNLGDVESAIRLKEEKARDREALQERTGS